MDFNFTIKGKRTLRENAATLLPEIYSGFFDRRPAVIGHPRRTRELHDMRKAGKPLRYFMEIMEPAGGRDFGRCLRQVKDLIEVMGEVHDADVNIPILRQQIAELRAYNIMHPRPDTRIHLSSLQTQIREMREERRQKFSKVCTILIRWEHTNFGQRLVRSLRGGVRPSPVRTTERQ